MKPKDFWTEDELVALTRVYEDLTLGFKDIGGALATALPRRTIPQAQIKACTLGLAKARKAAIALLPQVPKIYKPRAPRISQEERDRQRAERQADRQRRRDERNAAKYRERDARRATRRGAAEKKQLRAKAELAIAAAVKKLAVAEDLARKAGIAAPSLNAPARALASVPQRATVIPIKAGRCDRGERSMILKRLVNYVIPQLVKELGRRPEDIEAAIATVAAGGFKPEVSTFAPDEWVSEESTHARRAG